MIRTEERETRAMDVQTNQLQKRAPMFGQAIHFQTTQPEKGTQSHLAFPPNHPKKHGKSEKAHLPLGCPWLLPSQPSPGLLELQQWHLQGPGPPGPERQGRPHALLPDVVLAGGDEDGLLVESRRMPTTRSGFLGFGGLGGLGGLGGWGFLQVRVGGCGFLLKSVGTGVTIKTRK